MRVPPLKALTPDFCYCELMRRIVLFSTLTDSNQQTILDKLFPTEISDITIAYMPSDGIEGAQEYIKQWAVIAEQYGTKFSVINNRTRNVEEQNKLLAANVLVISGGNTFNLLHNLRESGLDHSIKQFLNKSDFVLSGFSAGALVLTPTIKVCSLPGLDENLIGLQDLEALSTVNFEVFPHYDEAKHKKILDDYRKTTSNRVREITDEGYLSIDL